MARRKVRKVRKRKTTNIYVITAGSYYYIGKSNNPWRRLEAHKQKAREGEGSNQKKNRIFRQYLRDLSMRILEKPKMGKWRQREMYHIAEYRKKYGRDKVLNMTDGGDGSSGGGHRDNANSGHPYITLMVLMILCGCSTYLLGQIS